MSGDREMKWFCMGVGLGTAVGLLWAPKSGSEMRRHLNRKLSDGVEYAKEQAAQKQKLANDLIEQGARTLRHHKENFKSAVDAGVDAYKEATTSTPSFSGHESTYAEKG